jgi:L-amino acid N-acyltransferase YncA
VAAAWLARAVSEAVSIRPARRGDVPAILEIYNAAVEEPASAYEDVPHTLKQREDWFAHFQQRNFPILVAECEGAVKGWGSLGPHQERAGFRFTGSVALYVGAAHRRRGIGGQLLEALLAAGRERGLHVVLAAIDSGNEASLQLHARHGFTEGGVFQEAGCKFGEWRDVVYLQRRLDDRALPGA